MALEVVGVGSPFLTAGGLMPGLELEITQLPGMQGRARPHIALALAQQMPEQNRELACHCDRGNVLPASSADPEEEGAQWTWRSRRHPRCLDQHAAGVAATLDTLASLRYAREQRQHVLSILNVPGSSMARESDAIMPTLAGPEIGVASTKAFTCQLAALACLAIAAGRARDVLSPEDEQKLAQALIRVPGHMIQALALEPQIEHLARELAKSRDALYLGRGTSFPVALEGALKLKEISYIHAEGYAAGELKHGPIALIDEALPVVVIAPFDRVFEKTASNMQEVAARGGKIILITDAKGAREAGIETMATLILPEMPSTVTPLVYAIPVQLIAYHTAVVMGTDVDQPRNLAKSVTVE
jgi:glutamine---fructose-6-phosphate transaminase (isomerizing)